MVTGVAAMHLNDSFEIFLVMLFPPQRTILFHSGDSYARINNSAIVNVT